MPETKIQAFLREFPWVQEALGVIDPERRKPISRAYVSVIEPRLMNYRLEKYIVDPDLLFDGIYHYEWIFLLDERHELLMYQKKVMSRRKYIFFGPRASEIYIEPAIVRPSDISIGSFIKKNFGDDVRVKTNAIHFMFSYYRDTQTVIIYKIPKGRSLLSFLEEEEKMEREKFRGEMTNENF